MVVASIKIKRRLFPGNLNLAKIYPQIQLVKIAIDVEIPTINNELIKYLGKDASRAIIK